MIEWRTIPRFRGYSFSNDGRVRRDPDFVPWKGTGGHRIPGRELLMQTNEAGYHVVMLKADDGKWKPRRVHRLMMEAFAGPVPAGADVRHLNGIRDDNRLENLAWGTRKENVADMKRHGSGPLGQDCSYALLTEDSVRAMRRERSAGLTWRALSEKYAVSMGAVRCAVSGRTWAHVTEEGG